LTVPLEVEPVLPGVTVLPAPKTSSTFAPPTVRLLLPSARPVRSMRLALPPTVILPVRAVPSMAAWIAVRAAAAVAALAEVRVAVAVVVPSPMVTTRLAALAP
jgi:hypothetical protein